MGLHISPERQHIDKAYQNDFRDFENLLRPEMSRPIISMPFIQKNLITGNGDDMSANKRSSADSPLNSWLDKLLDTAEKLLPRIFQKLPQELESIITMIDSKRGDELREALEQLYRVIKREKAPLQSNRLEKIADKIGVQASTLKEGIRIAGYWSALTSEEKFHQGALLSTSILEDLNIIGRPESEKFRVVTDALMSTFHSNASRTEKALAIAEALAQLSVTSFTGSPQSPTQVMDVGVVGSAMLPDGKRGFLLESGEVIPEKVLIEAHNVSSALKVVSTLVGDEKLKDKLLSLAETGLSSAQTNGWITDIQASKATSALTLANIVNKWSDMDDTQRFIASIQGSEIVLDALGKQAGKSMLGRVASGASAIVGIFTGGKQAVDVIDLLGDVPRSQGVKIGAIGLGSAGAAIGAGVATISSLAAGASLGATIGSSVPIVGTIVGGLIGAGVGALIGAFGSKKNKGQIARDSWRDAMEQAGFARKIDGSHHVPLADGSTYNIGRDGKSKLRSLDGSERLTHVLDWNDPLASQNVPLGHLYAIATGLNPTTHKKNSLFDAAAAQSLNAATSNAQSDADVRENFKAMLKAGGVTFASLRQQIELLRVTNRVSEHEYQVYLQHLSKLSGEPMTPIDRAQVHQEVVRQIRGMANEDGQIGELLELLTNSKQYEDSVIELQKRLDEQKEAEFKLAA
ncbi:hypothetical protein EBR25_02210 [bacterium]|nr:hypothetical protein [bacterium]